MFKTTNVQIILTCSNCGKEFNGSFWSFCPYCSKNVDLRSPTEQISDSQAFPPKHHIEL